MAGDPRKRQKKMARQAAKRKEKKHALVRQEHAGLAERLTAAARFPILHCWLSDTLDSKGMGTVVLSRELPNRQVAVASFLVDRFCLGVKDAFAALLTRSEYEDKYIRKMLKGLPMNEVPPADARKLVEGAIAYARSIGIAPHPDCLRTMRLFGDVDAATSQATFEFGKDGKPFFIAGPYDTPERCRQILAILTDSCGPGRFDYLIPFGDPRLADRIRILGPDEHTIGPDDEFFEDVDEV